MTTFTCDDCGNVLPINPDGGTGYGVYKDATGQERKRCYACCAKADVASMREHGRIVLYFTHGARRELGKPAPLTPYEITNWPGSLRFAAQNVRRFRHPFAREAYLGTFTGPDGKLWRFKNIGGSQVAHCRRAA